MMRERSGRRRWVGRVRQGHSRDASDGGMSRPDLEDSTIIVAMNRGCKSILALARHLRAEVLQVVLFLDGPDDAKSDVVPLRQPPDALRALRVELDPFRFGTDAGGAAHHR